MVLASALATLLLAATPAADAPRTRVALLPFENVTRAPGAQATVMETVEATLARKGYEVVAGAPVEEALRLRRIRYLDALPTDRVGELLAELGADACLSGTILTWLPSETDAAVALAARVVSREGALLWSDAGGLTAAETEGLLGLGRATNVRAVADRLVVDLLSGLPDRHLSSVRVPPPRWRAALGGPRVYRAREAVGKPMKLAILPLQNLSDARDAPRLVEAVLQQRLGERADMEVVGPADLRAAVIGSRLRIPSQLSLDQLRELARETGTSRFLRGTVLAWGRAAAGGPYPDVELYLSLLDVDSGRILWSGLHRRNGGDYAGLLKLGGVREETALAGRVVAELVDAFTRP